MRTLGALLATTVVVLLQGMNPTLIVRAAHLARRDVATDTPRVVEKGFNGSKIDRWGEDEHALLARGFPHRRITD